MKLTILLFTLVFALPHTGQSQSENEDSITKKIYDLNKALSNLHNTKKKEDILNFFSEDYAFTNVNNLMDGKTNIVHGDLQDFSSFLDLIINQIQVSYKITNIYNVMVKDGIGIALYDVEYEIVKDGETISKGYEAQINTVKKEGSQWKFLYSKRATLEESLSKGVCLSEIFHGKATNYIAKIRVPTGTHYEVDLIEFDFNKTDSGDIEILVENKVYQWTIDKTVWIEQNERRTKKLGVGLNESQVVSVILKNDLFTNHCTDIRVRK